MILIFFLKSYSRDKCVKYNAKKEIIFIGIGHFNEFYLI